MGNFFSIDSKLFTGLSKIADIMLLNFFWIITCIPIFTIGASSTAFYYTMRKSIKNGEGYVFREFFRTFVREFKQSTVIWIFFVILYFVLSLDFQIMFFAGKEGDIDSIVSKVFLVFIAVVTMWMLYVFPYLARFEDKTKKVLKNAGMIASLHIIKTIILFLLLLLTAFIVFIIPITLFFAPAIYVSVQVGIMERIFEKYIPQERKEEDKACN